MIKDLSRKKQDWDLEDVASFMVVIDDYSDASTGNTSHTSISKEW